jgi:NAD(P)-dependent dehydrogenase (short-subunit alcohol dehydrogenase family)
MVVRFALQQTGSRPEDDAKSEEHAVDELRFDDRVAVVTGAGRGLGRCHALLLASRGATVIVNDTGGDVHGEGTDERFARDVVAEITALGGAAVADSTSVATPDGGAAVVGHAVEEFGRLDIVVNNAGILQDKTLQNMTPEMFDAVIAVHLRGVFHVTQPAFVHMRERGYGRIVVTSSAAGLYGNFGQTNYASAKMGMVGLARTIALEGARRDIKVNVISPSAFTRMTDGLMGDRGWMFPPDLVSPVVAWLCHESCSVTGEVFSAGAGHVGRAVVAETIGYSKRDLTLEDVAANIDQIMDTSRLEIPADLTAASRLMLDALK